ncbi:hypothetical protein Fcan01_23266 [Folsomia candida]|uniref:Uncharacterized protein n=1 Tax=Folsomia candida TaxID=158441 RepID=A0A226DCU1_FOLCA|nr:hypothetical protein Fcan01_23266 [Folsomia candida]
MFNRRKYQLVWVVILFYATYALGALIKLGVEEEHKFENIKIADYFIPFQNCTIIVKIGANISSHIKTENPPPIILELYGFNGREMIEARFSIQRRRNPSPHCWASFSIFPEYNGKAKFDEPYFFKTLGLGPDFIDPFLPRQYFIFVTTIKPRIQHFVKNMDYMNLQLLGLREVIIVNVNHNGNDFIDTELPSSHLSMYYHNIYYIDKSIRGMEPSQQWYHIECLPHECFPQIDLVSRNISMLNKYFWYAIRIFDNKMHHIHHLFKMVEQRTLPNLQYRNIANLSTFNGFVAFWLLQDLMKHDYPDFASIHNFPPIMQIPRYKFTGLTYVAHDIQKFSYLSCYQVKSTNSVILSELMAPFETTVWMCVMASLIAVILLLTAALDNFMSKGILLTVGICLENSVLEYLYTYKSIKYHVGVGTVTSWTNKTFNPPT